MFAGRKELHVFLFAGKVAATDCKISMTFKFSEVITSENLEETRMEFNYGLEKKRFEEKWERLEVEYREAGMREDAIEEMKDYDWESFKRERIFCMHNQFYQGHRFANDDEIEDGKDPLLEKYFYSFTTEDNYFGERRYGWIEQLDDEELIEAVKSMKTEYIEIITQYVYEGKTIIEIAADKGVTKQTISEQISIIRKKLKKL